MSQVVKLETVQDIHGKCRCGPCVGIDNADLDRVLGVCKGTYREQTDKKDDRYDKRYCFFHLIPPSKFFTGSLVRNPSLRGSKIRKSIMYVKEIHEHA